MVKINDKCFNVTAAIPALVVRQLIQADLQVRPPYPIIAFPGCPFAPAGPSRPQVEDPLATFHQVTISELCCRQERFPIAFSLRISTKLQLEGVQLTYGVEKHKPLVHDLQ